MAVNCAHPTSLPLRITNSGIWYLASDIWHLDLAMLRGGGRQKEKMSLP